MYKLDELNYDSIFKYIDDFNYIKNEKIDNLRKYGEENNIPIIKRDVENFLKILLAIKKPKRILEIGTAIGFSSILMSETLKNNVEIKTLEISEDMKKIAQNNFEKLGLNNIEIILGDALLTLETLEGKFDFVFIDASKGHYFEFYKLIFNKLEKDAIILCDNVLHRGNLCKEVLEVPRRQRTIHRRMNTFFDFIKKDENVVYDMLPLGDGVLVISKK